MIIRRQENPRGWTVLPNALIEDARLSFRARGILGYLLSRPDGWETDSSRLARIALEGRDAIRTSLRELESLRYLIRVKVQGEGGLWRTETYVYDHTLSEEEAAAIRGVSKPVDSPGEALWTED